MLYHLYYCLNFKYICFLYFNQIFLRILVYEIFTFKLKYSYGIQVTYNIWTPMISIIIQISPSLNLNRCSLPFLGKGKKIYFLSNDPCIRYAQNFNLIIICYIIYNIYVSSCFRIQRWNLPEDPQTLTWIPITEYYPRKIVKRYYLMLLFLCK